MADVAQRFQLRRAKFDAEALFSRDRKHHVGLAVPPVDIGGRHFRREDDAVGVEYIVKYRRECVYDFCFGNGLTSTKCRGEWLESRRWRQKRASRAASACTGCWPR